MKRKFILFITAVIVATSFANAQIARGTATISSTFYGSGSGFFINITPETDSQTAATSAYLNAKGAYYVARNLALTVGVSASSDKYGKSDPVTSTGMSLGVKYHFIRGFYGDLAYFSSKSGKKDALSYGRFELGYDIYITDYFYIEPAGYFLVID
jgi:hypothetical protein